MQGYADIVPSAQSISNILFMLAEASAELKVDDVDSGDDACALRGMIQIQQLLLFQVKLGSCRSNLNLGSN